MAVKKSTTPSLSDLTGNTDPVVEDETPETPVEPSVGDVTHIDPSEDPVHKWEENHSHNLATVHPDVHIAGKPSEQAGVTRVITETVYAGENIIDDKGRKGAIEDYDENDPVLNGSEYAPENDDDDKGIK